MIKKRSRKAANLYKEPSSDLSDLDSDGSDLPQKGRRLIKTSKRAKFAKDQEESKGGAAAAATNSGRTYGKC